MWAKPQWSTLQQMSYHSLVDRTVLWEQLPTCSATSTIALVKYHSSDQANCFAVSLLFLPALASFPARIQNVNVAAWPHSNNSLSLVLQRHDGCLRENSQTSRTGRSFTLHTCTGTYAMALATQTAITPTTVRNRQSGFITRVANGDTSDASGRFTN